MLLAAGLVRSDLPALHRSAPPHVLVHRLKSWGGAFVLIFLATYAIILKPPLRAAYFVVGYYCFPMRFCSLLKRVPPAHAKQGRGSCLRRCATSNGLVSAPGSNGGSALAHGRKVAILTTPTAIRAIMSAALR